MTPANLQGHKISPVIALLTEVKEDQGPDFGKVHSFCEELHQGISELGGSFYVFSLKGFSDEGVEGFYYDEDEDEWDDDDWKRKKKGADEDGTETIFYKRTLVGGEKPKK